MKLSTDDQYLEVESLEPPKAFLNWAHTHLELGVNLLYC